MRVDIVTIFPDYFGAGRPSEAFGGAGPLGVSLIGKAGARGDIDFRVHDLRQWATDAHHTVDDTPFGGGPGMVMKPDVWGDALNAVLAGAAELTSADPSAANTVPANTVPANTVPANTVPANTVPANTVPANTVPANTVPAETVPAGPADTGDAPSTVPADPSAADPAPADPVPARLIVPTPSGAPFTQEMAAAYAGEPHLIFACGRYEGIDARVAADARTRMPVDEVSIGDYVLAGGEAAVVVMLEAICRLLPGVLGNEQSAADDSFGGGSGEAGRMRGLLEGPVYTRPRSWRGIEIPPVLLSGDHGAIARWRRDEALRRTAAVRPDLVSRVAADPDGLDVRDRAVLADAGFPVDSENMAH